MLKTSIPLSYETVMLLYISIYGQCVTVSFILSHLLLMSNRSFFYII